MGMMDILQGHIEEAWPGLRGDEEAKARKNIMANEIRRHNWNVIQQLPDESRWPPIHPRMFYQVPKEHNLQYRSPLILFGGSFKSIYSEWEKWIEQYEELFRKLYWETIRIDLYSETIGHHSFRWDANNDWIAKMTDEQLTPLSEWKFSGNRHFK